MQKLIFYDEPSFPNYWYNHVNTLYKNILQTKIYDIEVRRLLFGDCWGHNKLYETLSSELNKIDKTAIYILNPIHYAIFITNIRKQGVAEKIYKFLGDINYLLIWQEVLTDDFHVIGYNENMYNPVFSKYFFKHAKKILVSNRVSIKVFDKHDIHNYEYNIITGYSEINNIKPLSSKINKDIDILIYGTLNKKYHYRFNLIERIKKDNKYGYNIVVSDNLFNDNLIYHLKRTKIVIHVPSYANLQHMPWPKITHLQAMKVLFMIEENDEMHSQGLDNIVLWYKQNDVADIYDKLGKIINDNSERNEVIERNYDWIKDYDMDKNLIKIG